MSLQITILSDKKSTQESAFDFLTEYEVRAKLLAEVIRSEMLSLRSGNANTKTRAEVRGGGRKPWKQKGTGRARHGSIRSPLWVGGGVAFGPRSDRNWNRKINKTARIAALKSILKDRLVDQKVFQLDEKLDLNKTKSAVEILERNGITERKTILSYTTSDKEMLKGFCNTQVTLINVANIKVFKLVHKESLVLTKSAKEALEAKLNQI
jgi:large subunit ribosomal protein L4